MHLGEKKSRALLRGNLVFYPGVPSWYVCVQVEGVCLCSLFPAGFEKETKFEFERPISRKQGFSNPDAGVTIRGLGPQG